MRKAIKLVLLVLFLCAMLLFVLLVDFSPLVKADGNQQVNQADTVQPLIDQLRTSLRSRYKPQTISVSRQQAESLAGFAHRAKEQASADFVFSDASLIIKFTYRFDAGITDMYINVTLQVDEGDGMNLQGVRIGKLRLPGAFALSIAQSIANRYTSSEVATKAIATVQRIDVESSGVNIAIAPMDALLREFKNIETGGSSTDTRLLKIKVAHYLRVLDGMYVPPTGKRSVGASLAYYLHAVMKEASVLSSEGSATLENEAAIMALTIYAGSPRFATLVGDLSFAITKIPYAIPRPVLRERGDLSLHFMFSAAIKLMSEKGVSIAVGEFKELMDRGEGGSGYSFVDLAADMAGAHFAALAVDPKTAQQVQAILAGGANEMLFMVPIDDLEEGLSKAEFSKKYGEVDSPEYKEVVERINRRLAGLPITPDVVRLN
jgi:hypothetical protein